MGVRYFCDNCGSETRAGELETVVISIPPQSETFDVCAECVLQFRRELERCGQAKQRHLSAAASAVDRRAPSGVRAVLALPGVTALARGVSYIAVFVALFIAVTLLTSLR